MLGSQKDRIKRALNALGVEAHRFHPASSPLARLIAAMNAFEIDLVLDVGANTGQYGTDLRAGGYKGRIVSFEPITQAHAQLAQRSRHDQKWTVHSRCALGAYEGEIEINISANSVSSSVLPMLEPHSNAAPGSAYVGQETAPMTTVDGVAGQYLAGSRAPFLKIDTQGYEWQVLDGAAATLGSVRGVQMELSLLPLYEGQHLWQDCIRRLEGEGFVLWSVQPAFVDPANGRTMQLDGLFFRQ
ncbi:FkbM family methyltransferase [Thiobacillus sedimenti]|uniref:FkbM family methyltransferase n=1 Tax=Thiobacillus sedimenti TaxID=3110231 RepID=A0ABZ1CGT1_9PROT|nr:FkbM family methyltransferase [Thiobacillus sp. SCUT-2]WRS38404.1 FkbM family methyltransferase [Thiobacillus sp. SCUT-2]